MSREERVMKPRVEGKRLSLIYLFTLTVMGELSVRMK